jgi:hypothetical protein
MLQDCANLQLQLANVACMSALLVTSKITIKLLPLVRKPFSFDPREACADVGFPVIV